MTMTVPRILLMAVSSLLLLTGCDHAATTESDTHLMNVSVQPLQRSSSYTLQHRYAGRVEVAQNSALGFEAGGKLEQISVDTGEAVSLGQVLARLDTRLLQAEANRLQAQKHEALARLKLARTSLERLSTLERKGYASAQNLDELQAEVEALEASIAVIDSGLAGNRLQQAKSVLTAPFAARIGRRMADEGEVVAAGQPVLQLLTEADTEFSIGIPPNRVAQLSTDQLYRVHIGSQSVQARLLQIGADLDPGSRTQQIRFTPVTPTTLVNGALVQLELPRHYQDEGYRVPLSALTDGVRGLWQVYVVRGSEQGYLIEARDVRVLQSDAHTAYVSGALQPGEQLVTQGLHRIVPGQQVRPQLITAIARNKQP